MIGVERGCKVRFILDNPRLTPYYRKKYYDKIFVVKKVWVDDWGKEYLQLWEIPSWMFSTDWFMYKHDVKFVYKNYTESTKGEFVIRRKEQHAKVSTEGS